MWIWSKIFCFKVRERNVFPDCRGRTVLGKTRQTYNLEALFGERCHPVIVLGFTIHDKLHTVIAISTLQTTCNRSTRYIIMSSRKKKKKKYIYIFFHFLWAGPISDLSSKWVQIWYIYQNIFKRWNSTEYCPQHNVTNIQEPAFHCSVLYLVIKIFQNVYWTKIGTFYFFTQNAFACRHTVMTEVLCVFSLCEKTSLHLTQWATRSLLITK